MNQTKLPRQRQWIFAGFGLIFTSFVSIMSFQLLQEIAQQSRAHALFQPVDAVVERTSVREFRLAKRGTLSPITEYRADITYRYVINGAVFRSNQYAFRDPAKSAGAAHALVAASPVGAHVVAYYDPSEPAKAVIDNGLPSLSGPLITIFLAMFAGLAIVVAGLRGTQRLPWKTAINE
jgi:hypothetical protein